VILKEAQVRLREANVEPGEAQVRLREANVEPREAQVPFREANVYPCEPQVPLREANVKFHQENTLQPDANTPQFEPLFPQEIIINPPPGEAGISLFSTPG
jgi:hypothetical protein